MPAAHLEDRIFEGGSLGIIVMAISEKLSLNFAAPREHRRMLV
jgi:hypothetical protein